MSGVRSPEPAPVPATLASYMDGLRTHDVDKIAGTFAADLTFVTPARRMTAAETLAFLRALYRAFPDWQYRNEPPECRGAGRWRVLWRQGGTHTGPLDLPGFPAVAPTGRRVAIPEHYFYYRVEGAKLVEIRPDPVPGGAPRGIFEQIGVELPPL